MTLTPAQKITARLNEANAQTDEQKLEAAKAAFLAPHKAKAEALRLAGPTKDCQEITRHITAIYELLKHDDARVQLIPAEFYDTQQVNRARVAFDDGTPDFYVAGSYGWRPAQLKTGISYVWKDQETQVSSWRTRPNGKRTLYVGGYSRGDSAGSFQTLKGGDMKYYDIARTFFRCIVAADQKAKAEVAKAQNQSTATAVGADVGFKPYNGVTLSVTASSQKPVLVKIDRTLSLSQAEATELLLLLKKFGLG